MLQVLGRKSLERLGGLLSVAPGGLRTCAGSAHAEAAADGQHADSQQGQIEREKMVSKLLYRSRQRGFLELDLLVGLWAEQQVPQMDTHMLQQFTVVLDQENPDLFKWLTGQQEPPGDMQANPAFVALKQHVAQQLSDSCHTASQAAPGKEWLRGWDDSWRSPNNTQPAAAAAAEAAAAEPKAQGS